LLLFLGSTYELKNQKINFVNLPVDTARNVLTEILNAKKIQERLQGKPVPRKKVEILPK